MDKKHRVPQTAITEKRLRIMLRKAIREADSAGEWARDHGVTPQALSSFLNRTQTAGLKIPEALGYRPQTVYIPLEEDPISTNVTPRRRR